MSPLLPLSKKAEAGWLAAILTMPVKLPSKVTIPTSLKTWKRKTRSPVATGKATRTKPRARIPMRRVMAGKAPPMRVTFPMTMALLPRLTHPMRLMHPMGMTLRTTPILPVTMAPQLRLTHLMGSMAPMVTAPHLGLMHPMGTTFPSRPMPALTIAFQMRMTQSISRSREARALHRPHRA